MISQEENIVSHVIFLSYVDICHLNYLFPCVSLSKVSVNITGVGLSLWLMVVDVHAMGTPCW